MPDNIYTKATIIKQKNAEIENFQLGSFPKNSNSELALENQSVETIGQENANSEGPILLELKNLGSELQTIKQKISFLENDGLKGRDLDEQVITAIKELKQYASFFEKATFALEAKILKTSLALAKKIVSIEVSKESALIAKKSIENIMDKIKTASKVTIHLNPKDYLKLKDVMDLQPHIQLYEDANVSLGGVVIASDLGNFDGKIEAKIEAMLESLETVI